MSELIVEAKGLSKKYGAHWALDNIDLDIPTGKIIGLIGPNGAGKTTALRAILGLTPYSGELKVLGKDPHRQHTELLNDVCFIADTAILPRWIKVNQLLDYMEGVHTNFNREQAEAFLTRTNIPRKSKVKQLSKGMVTQLHLAIVMAIDAKLLVLDEPTLGLDIIHRKQFYSTLLGEYYDHNKTIIITTHQVEEIEHILTDVMFIDQGKIVLREALEDIQVRYVQVDVEHSELDQARSHSPLLEQNILGGARFIYQKTLAFDYASLGKISIPSISDLFIAKLQKN